MIQISALLLVGLSAVCLGYDSSLPEPYSTHEVHQSKFRHDVSRVRKLQLAGPGEATPLYPGYGTHFSYIYVGTPGQRVSVIVDTGSSFTAFPCIGCQECGQHTDSYWDLGKSSTATPLICSGKPCSVSQGYSEGSTWAAVKIKDKLYVGGESVPMMPNAKSYAVDFTFGCQTSETGLFRTQLADGIMGMGMSDITLPNQLYVQKITKTKIFTMCFKKGGGIMTLGGVDQRVHLKPEISWAKLSLVGGSGWYGVQLLDILLSNRKSGAATSVEGDPDTYSTGEGSIVDSGTTDTYLPNFIQKKFKSVFKDLTGLTYSNDNQRLSAAQLAKVPNVIFRIKDVNGKSFDVTMPWDSLADGPNKDGTYAFRIYFQDGAGAVLGANFMSGHNVIFDQEGSRVGFAESNCDYDQLQNVKPSVPHAAPVQSPVASPVATPSDETPIHASTPSTHTSNAPTTAQQDTKNSESEAPSDDEHRGSSINTTLLLSILGPFLVVASLGLLCLYCLPRSIVQQGDDLEMVQSVVFNSQDNVFNPFHENQDETLDGDEEEVGHGPHGNDALAKSSHSFLPKVNGGSAPIAKKD